LARRKNTDDGIKFGFTISFFGNEDTTFVKAA
jgi:hypothetical protein